MEERNYLITIVWWYTENRTNLFTRVHCKESLVSVILDKYNGVAVKEIYIEEVKLDEHNENKETKDEEQVQ